MDLRLVTIDNTWDFTVVDGLPLTVDGTNELIQRALTAAFLQKNTIPLLPEVGGEWTRYITGEISLPEMDAQVRANINLFMDRLDYVPFYNIDETTGRITFTVTNVQLAGV